MNIESLRYFYDVVEFKSISKVAKNSHISQPALSHQLFKLEREFNGKLLERSNKGVEITQKGEVVYEYAKKILELYDLLYEEVNNEGVNKNKLEITNTSIYSNSIFLAIAGQFGSIFNNYNVNMKIEFINGEGLLINKKSDIIIGNEKLEDKNIKSEYIGSDKLVLISRKNMTKEELKESKIGLLDDKFTKEIEIKLKDMPEVKDVTYESKDQAFINFQKGSENNKGLLEGYSLQNNPFPASYVVKLNKPEDAQTVANAIKNMPGVDSIGNQQDLINTITRIVNAVRIIGVILFLILIGVAIFLIMNTTKLTVYSRRREVGIMKFVGATDWFIRWPFIIEGMIIGLVGAILATILVGFAYQGFFSWITTKMLFVDIVGTSYIYTSLLWQFAIAGTVIGGGASYFSLRKFLVV